MAASPPASRSSRPPTRMDQTSDGPGDTGRVLGLDLGEARIGVAVSDPERRLAIPVGTVHVGQPPGELKAIAALVGERLTTVEAERSLREAGVRARDRRAVVDRTAAAVILQAWLDAHAAR